MAQAAANPTETRSQREAENEQPALRSSDSDPDWRLYLYSGASYSEGDYGTDTNTETLAIPIGARLRNGNFRLSASIPYLRVEGSPSVIPGDGEQVVDDLPTARDVREGFGDLSLRARYLVPRLPGGFQADLLGRVKIPTGSDEERLSTGEFDYGAGIEVSRAIGNIEPFVEAQYRINGDPPDRDYRNTWLASAGTSVRLGRSRASLSYEYSQSRVRGREAAHSLDGSFATPISRRLLLSTFGSVGLSERASDFSVGAVLTLRAF